jgi:hypothetical protein
VGVPGFNQFSGQRKTFAFASQTWNLRSHDHTLRRYPSATTFQG